MFSNRLILMLALFVHSLAELGTDNISADSNTDSAAPSPQQVHLSFGGLSTRNNLLSHIFKFVIHYQSESIGNDSDLGYIQSNISFNSSIWSYKS